jgi:hypothetical protein
MLIALLPVFGLFSLAGVACAATVVSAYSQHGRRDAVLSCDGQSRIIEAKSTMPLITVHSTPGEAYIPCVTGSPIKVHSSWK